MRASLLFLLLFVAGAVTVGCGSQVIEQEGGGGEGGSACLGADCHQQGCPTQAPSEGASCDLPDFTECTFADPPDCLQVFRCEPVYPEAGAPSVWRYQGEEGAGCECLAAESCAPGDTEVESCPPGGSCYEVIGCDGPVLCFAGGGCTEVPLCDPGDFEVSDCPPDAGCYIVQVCGGSILCADAALPQHGCPPLEPEPGTACSTPDQFCDYDTSPGCFSTHLCDQGTWAPVGGGCS